jgi:hypothetical protein
VKLQRGKTGWAAWLGAACIVLLLVGTTAQAVHFCGVPAVGSGGTAQLSAVSSSGNSTLCLTCLMAQSAAAALFFITFFPTRLRSAVVRPPQVRPRSFLDSFHLYVRPPPAF